MRFLLSVIDGHPGADHVPPASADEMRAIDAFNDRLRADGHWILAVGLTPPSEATVVDHRAGADRVSDGPFVVTPEWVSGFWLIDAPDRATALALAREGSRACHRRVEVRAIIGG